ncbi:MAG TPA: spermidine/putrescine ABC transporter substrate-binding protein [Clostridiales bacterium]|nr:spermidine/putrescine ABC transporter substrate-binding protein [Clostridiales bacterium]
MKRTLSIILAATMIAAVGVTLGGCGGGTQEKQEINVFNWGEYISNGEGGTMDVIAEFEKKYNIKVNYTNYESNEEMYNLIKSSNSAYDVIIPSDYMISKLIAEDMLNEINLDNVPNYSNVMDDYKNLPFDTDNKYSVPYSGGVVAMVYNTDMISEKPTSWKVLWDKQYSGNILMFNNSRDAMAIAMQLKGITPDVVTKADVDTATSYLKEQKPLLKRYVMDQVFTEMEGSQAAVAPYYAGDIAMMMENNEKLDYVLPEEGSNRFVDSMCIPKGSKNKELAEKFINYMLEPEVAKANAEYIGYSTPNQKAYDLLDDEMKNNELMYPTQEYLDKCYYFSNLPDDVYNYMQEQFLQVQS